MKCNIITLYLIEVSLINPLVYDSWTKILNVPKIICFFLIKNGKRKRKITRRPEGAHQKQEPGCLQIFEIQNTIGPLVPSSIHGSHFSQASEYNRCNNKTFSIKETSRPHHLQFSESLPTYLSLAFHPASTSLAFHQTS